MITRLAKRVALNLSAAMSSPVLGRRLLRDRGVILMLHRFHDPELKVGEQDTARLRTSLAWLRREGYPLLDLDVLLRGLASGDARVSGGIAFTIDDGYADQARLGAPVFAEFDCPVTTFVSTGFLDRTLWFWWDRIAWTFANTRARQLRVTLGDQTLAYAWSGTAERDAAALDFTWKCKAVPDAVKLAAITVLATEAGVALPDQAPPEYAPMSWDELRQCETRGMTFGPHTVTHPLLARADDAQADFEIGESWRRLSAEARKPSQVFCYPNGQPGDYGEREYRSLRAHGLFAAVVGTPGYAHAAMVRGEGTERFRVPRYNWPDDDRALAKYASGMERLGELTRRSGS